MAANVRPMMLCGFDPTRLHHPVRTQQPLMRARALETAAAHQCTSSVRFRPVRCCANEPSPGADVAQVVPVPAQMWHGVGRVPAEMWRSLDSIQPVLLPCESHNPTCTQGSVLNVP